MTPNPCGQPLTLPLCMAACAVAAAHAVLGRQPVLAKLLGRTAAFPCLDLPTVINVMSGPLKVRGVAVCRRLQPCMALLCPMRACMCLHRWTLAARPHCTLLKSAWTSATVRELPACVQHMYAAAACLHPACRVECVGAAAACPGPGQPQAEVHTRHPDWPVTLQAGL
jgi:hypothetical protein